MRSYRRSLGSSLYQAWFTDAGEEPDEHRNRSRARSGESEQRGRR